MKNTLVYSPKRAQSGMQHSFLTIQGKGTRDFGSSTEQSSSKCLSSHRHLKSHSDFIHIPPSLFPPPFSPSPSLSPSFSNYFHKGSWLHPVSVLCVLTGKSQSLLSCLLLPILAIFQFKDVSIS